MNAISAHYAKALWLFKPGRQLTDGRYHGRYRADHDEPRLGFILAGSLAAVAGALALAADWSGGALVLAVGALASLAAGPVTAWILLAEVRRAAT
jgi:hypothetical protein